MTIPVAQVLEKIRNESSKNRKVEILKDNKDNELLKKVLFYTYNPVFNYFVKSYDPLDGNEAQMFLDDIFQTLDLLINRELTGNAARSALQRLDTSLNKANRDILRGIIDKSQHLGIDEKSINKVWKDLIPTTPYMRCSLTDQLKKIKYPAFVQQKCDGLFVNIIYKNKTLEFITRAGNIIPLNVLREELIYILSHLEIGDFVMHGEILVEGLVEGVEKRQTGNGLVIALSKKDKTLSGLQKKLDDATTNSKFSKISSEITGKLKEYEETDLRLQLVVWDIVSYSGWINGFFDVPYDERFRSLENFESSHIKVVETEVVTSLEEANVFYLKQLSNGFEGAVLKNQKGFWGDKTSTDQIKLKDTKVCELLVIGYKHGDKNGKYEKGIGTLTCTSSDGLVNVDVAGLTDALRGFERVDPNDSSKGIQLIEGFDLNQYNGSIIGVKFNSLIQAVGREDYSLFLPRYGGERIDKTEADDLEYIKKL